MVMNGDVGVGNVDEYDAMDLASEFDSIWSSINCITDEVSDCKVDCKVDSNVIGLYMNVNKERIGLANVRTIGLDA